MVRAFDPEHHCQRPEQLASRLEVRRSRGGPGNPAHLGRNRAGEPRDHRGVRRQPDDVTGRQRAVELGHREILVDDRAALEQDHPDELVSLEPEQARDCAYPVTELAREAAQHVGVPVADVVVDGDPSVPGRRDDGAA